MSDKQTADVDLTQGVQGGVHCGRRPARRSSRRPGRAARSQRRTVLRHSRTVHALPRSTRRGHRRRQHDPLSAASRVFRSGDRRRIAGARPRSASVLASRASGRHGLRPGAVAGADRSASHVAAFVDRDRWRRRRRDGGGRYAAPGGIRWSHLDGQRRRGSAGRPTKSFEGLSRRRGQGRLDPAMAVRVVRRTPHRSRAWNARGANRARHPDPVARGRIASRVWRAADRDGRPADSAGDSRS